MRDARSIPDPRDGGPLARWFAEHGTRLCHWLGRRVGCPETAADLAQDVCVRLLACAGVRGEGQLRALAYRIANQVLIDHHRRTALRLRMGAARRGPRRNRLGHPGAGAGAGRGPNARAGAGRARRSAGRLPHGLRAAGPDGQSYREIAARLGISERMVAKHLARAMCHCRDRIASD